MCNLLEQNVVPLREITKQTDVKRLIIYFFIITHTNVPHNIIIDIMFNIILCVIFQAAAHCNVHYDVCFHSYMCVGIQQWVSMQVGITILWPFDNSAEEQFVSRTYSFGQGRGRPRAETWRSRSVAWIFIHIIYYETRRGKNNSKIIN